MKTITGIYTSIKKETSKAERILFSTAVVILIPLLIILYHAWGHDLRFRIVSTGETVTTTYYRPGHHILKTMHSLAIGDTVYIHKEPYEEENTYTFLDKKGNSPQNDIVAVVVDVPYL